jgi:predicted transcriptional regulator
MSEYIEETFQELLKRGKNKGALTFTEVIDTLHPSNLSEETMEIIINRLEQQGIKLRNFWR